MISTSYFFDTREVNSYIILEISSKKFIEYGFHLILEGDWRPSGLSDWYQRVDNANPQMNIQRHIHLAHKKHIKVKDRQVSWNDNGTRHDKKSFDVNISGLNNAKQIARKALKLSSDIVLEDISKNENLDIIMESGNFEFPDNMVYLKIK